MLQYPEIRVTGDRMAGELVLPVTGAAEPLPEILARFSRNYWRFKCTDTVKLLIDGETFGEMLGAIDKAVSSVDLETYILRDDKMGRRFLDALGRAAVRGVNVRVIYDFLGSSQITPNFIFDMLDAGISVSVFHPLLVARPYWVINRRDHRKIMIVDRHVSFTGGINIADDYASFGDGGLGWRDTHVRIDSAEIADQFQLLFDYSWRKATPYEQTLSRRGVFQAGLKKLKPPMRKKRAYVNRLLPGMCPDNGEAVQVIGNKEFRLRRLIHNTYLQAINRAQRYIIIQNAYFIPDHDIRQALARAVRRGVKVSVVLAHNSDVKIIAYASRHIYKDLLESGVRIFEYPEFMMHAKTAVIDDAWSVVGSYNFDHQSLFYNLEVVAVIAGNDFAVKLRDQMIMDISKSIEVRADYKPSFIAGMVESGAYYLRKWL